MGIHRRRGAEAGQLFRISEDESFWTYVLMEVDAVVAVSGRGNTRAVLKPARMLNKPVFPLGIIEGAASDVWGQLKAPELKFLGDRSRSPRDLAESIAKNIRQKNAPPWIVGQVFVVMNFGQDPSTFEAIAEGCSQIGLNAVRADDNPDSSVIVDYIKRLILESEFIIVDLTHERPNVYYELSVVRVIETTSWIK
jgi:hypothetical protein